jgi:hypothetical protein
MKILAVESGGDWYDASVRYLINTSGRSGAELKDEYEKSNQHIDHEWKAFHDWAILKGYCRRSTSEDLDVIYID